MWQGGNNDCWAARLVSHLHHLDILPAGTQQLWQQCFNPMSVEASMDAITAANWEILRDYTPYRTMCQEPRASGLTLVCFAQHFSALHAGIERHVYHNMPAWQWKPIMQLVTGRLLLRCGTSHWKGPQRTSGSCPCAACWRTRRTTCWNALAWLTCGRATPRCWLRPPQWRWLGRTQPCGRFSSPHTLLSWLTSWCWPDGAGLLMTVQLECRLRLRRRRR